MTSFRVLALSVALLAAAPAAAQQQTPTPEQIKAMLEKTRPGEPHKQLAALEGRWALDVTLNMGKPIKATGTATNRTILGGRFLVSERTTTMPPGPMGDRIDTMTIYGFDRRTNEFTIIELDSMGTYWVSAAGTPRDNAIVMTGESIDDHAGHREMRKYDMVLRIVDADTYLTQIVFKFPNREPLTIVETVHRRIK